jgi:hypothetical protein
MRENRNGIRYVGHDVRSIAREASAAPAATSRCGKLTNNTLPWLQNQKMTHHWLHHLTPVSSLCSVETDIGPSRLHPMRAYVIVIKVLRGHPNRGSPGVGRSACLADLPEM